MTEAVFDRVENIMRKGENAGSQHFLLFPQSFLETFYHRKSLKRGFACIKELGKHPVTYQTAKSTASI